MVNQHFADRLLASIQQKNAPVCVGFDPVIDRLPHEIRETCKLNQDVGFLLKNSELWENVAEAFLAFGRGVIEVIADQVPAIKINIAFFEPFHAHGLKAYDQLVSEAKLAGLIVIGDIKRADIGHSTTQYALAHLGMSDQTETISSPDSVTVNPYFGIDGIKPFMDIASENNSGLFVLVQTSNPSAAQIQNLSLSDGTLVCEQVARLVQEWASEKSMMGSGEYSCIGAVVSPRDLDSTRRIRSLMPSCIFLVPGFGAQGRSTTEVAECFKPDGTGAIINASRSILYAYEQERYRKVNDADWKESIGQSCGEMVDTIRKVISQ